jgi:hypothetical protein
MRDLRKNFNKELVMMIDCMNANEKLLWKKNPFPWMKIGEMRESKIVIRKDADGDEKSVSWMKTLQ